MNSRNGTVINPGNVTNWRPPGRPDNRPGTYADVTNWRPDNRPGTNPGRGKPYYLGTDNRPGTYPSNKMSWRPDNRPGTNAGNVTNWRPDNRPGTNADVTNWRPGGRPDNRPGTNPGNVTNWRNGTATGRYAATGINVTDLNRDYRSQSNINKMELEYTRQQNDAMADFLERMERNIYFSKQRRELDQDERKNKRNARSQEKIAAQQAEASKYASKQSADAQMFAANADASARQFDTKTKAKTEFSGILANLAASASQSKNADADRMADMYKSIMQTYNTGSGQFRYWG